MTSLLPPTLHNLPISLPIEGAVRLELEEGIPIFRASSVVQSRIEALLDKQQTIKLSADQEQELDFYEEVNASYSHCSKAKSRAHSQNPHSRFAYRTASASR